jgi:RHS repeat-associated protein
MTEKKTLPGRVRFLLVVAAMATALPSFAQQPTRNLLPAESVFYSELRQTTKFYGFNEFSAPAVGVLPKKYRRLQWSGSVKESNTLNYTGTQRADFTGEAMFTGQVLTNGLLRREFRNLDDPSSEGDGTGGPYLVVGDGSGACGPLNRRNLLNEFSGVLGLAPIAVVDQSTVINATRREWRGTMGLAWTKIHLPCNSFDRQIGSDVFQSRGPAIEELSLPAEGEVVSNTRLEGYFVAPTANSTFRMENNQPWSALSTTPIVLDDLSYECRAQFRPLGCECAAGKTYTLIATVETWEGASAHVTSLRRFAVATEASNSTAGEMDAKFILRAEKLGQSVKLISAALEVDGSSCASCGSEPGAAAAALDSVNWSMNLGFVDGGLPAGTLQVRSDTWTTALYTPASLTLAAAGMTNPSSAVLRRADTTLRQIWTGTYLVDIVTAAEDGALPSRTYEIRFFAQAGSAPSAANPDLLVPAGAALYVTRFTDPDGQGTRLSINRYAAGQTLPVTSVEYGFNATTNTWSFTEAGLRRTDKTITPLSATEEKVVTAVWDLTSGSFVKVSETAEKFRRYVLGALTHRVLYERVLDPAGAALVSTWTYAVSGNLPRLTQSTSHTGSWSTNTYSVAASANGDVNRSYSVFSPFVNSGPTSPSTQQRRTLEGEFPDADFDGDGRRDSHGEKYELINGTFFSAVRTKRYTKPVIFNGQSCTMSETAQLHVPDLGVSDPTLRWERRYTYAGGTFSGRTAYVRHADLTIETITYALDVQTGQTTEVRSSGAPDASQLNVIDGTRTTTVTDIDGRLVRSTTVDIASGLVTDSQAVLNRDAFGRPTAIALHDGSIEEFAYSPCCGLLERSVRHGVVTTFIYDALGRQTSETSAGLTTRNTYDALNRLVKTTRVGSDGSELVLSTNSYDLAGRLIGRTDALARPTIFVETYNADRTTTRTTTFADASQLIEITNADDSLASRGGSSAVPSFRQYVTGVVGNIPCVITTEFKGPAGTSPTEWVKTYVDGIGRQLRVEFPDNAFATSEYDAANRQTAEHDPDGVTTLFGYNSRGERDTVAVDRNNNGMIDFAVIDRITRTVNSVVTKTDGSESFVVQRVATQLWIADNADTPASISIAESAADGLHSWQTSEGLTTASVVSYDGAGGRTVTTTAPDGTISEQIFSQERLISAVTRHPSLGTLGSTSYGYDPHGRLQSTTDLRNGTTLYTYFDDGQLQTITTPDPDPTRSGDGYDPQTTTFAYDALGRRATVTNPDGGVVNTSYYPTGQVKRTWGARTYPTEYAYDDQGRVQTLSTWQDFAGDTGKAVTTWNYDPKRGFVLNKRYADNTGPSYTYTAAGRLKTRTWARGTVTTYSYDSVGDLTSTTYSDATPGVTFTYDRLGRIVTDSQLSTLNSQLSSACTYAYQGLTSLITSESHTGLLDGLSVTRSYDPLLRLRDLSVSSASSVFNQTTYAYDDASRLSTVTAGPNTATYGYLTNSALVQSVTFANNGATRLTTTKTYDNLNRLSAISNQPSASGALNSQPSTLNYSYAYNASNQRTRVTREDNAHWNYTYDLLGQVTSSRKLLADETPVLAHDYAWTYDDIGNHRMASRGAVSSENFAEESYTPNLLNQYTQRTVPGAIDVIGAAKPDATVTVVIDAGLPQPVTRQGELFVKHLTLDNSVAAQTPQIKITGVKNNVGPAGEDAVSQETWRPFIAKTPEFFTYDADGDLTSDGRWTYTWDAENRLIGMETRADLVGQVADLAQRVEFTYDTQSRRIAKKVSTWNGTGWTAISERRFLYDGWNLLAEFTLNPQLSTLNLSAAYTWGLDLSGSSQGAGGIGGLLISSLTDPSTLNAQLSTNFYVYDGNGNVGGLIGASDGTVTARYDYNVFGETILTEGAFAAANPFRFSTKFTDLETGHLYYGYRCYSPETGRWLSRDSIGEEGGASLYAYVANAPTSWCDPFGLALYAFDGTNNDGERDTWESDSENGPTNVKILYDLFKGKNRYYAYGVGTRDGVLNSLGLAGGLGGKSRERNALKVVEEFIKSGDTIADITGFSRGAAEARDFANRLSEKYPCMTIRWIGLFDTVASFGIGGNGTDIGYNFHIPKNAANVFQITAGGERRKFFPLMSVNASLGQSNPNSNVIEVEIPGAVHSDVGGGYRENRGLANLALKMMRENGVSHGVPFGQVTDERYLGTNGVPHDSRWWNDKIYERVHGNKPRKRKIFYAP